MTKRTDIEELYEAHFRDAVRLATMILADSSSAEDVAQDAFLRAASRIGALRDRASFPAYLRKAVIRTAISQRRARDRRSDREMRAYRPAVEEPAETVGSDQLLLQAVQALPIRQRTAIVLRYWLDLSEREIADAMRCPRGTVKSNLSRALTTLRQEVPTDA